MLHEISLTINRRRLVTYTPTHIHTSISCSIRCIRVRVHIWFRWWVQRWGDGVYPPIENQAHERHARYNTTIGETEIRQENLPQTRVYTYTRI